ncbi:MAG: hypothetical protein ACHQ53_06790 [Polyangiales bacterium]
MIALAVAQPALAETPHKLGGDRQDESLGAKKTKKAKDDSAPAADDSKDKSSDKGSDKGSDKPAEGSSGGTAGSASGQPAEMSEGDGWEKPPMEQEKPIGPPPKVAEEPKIGDGKQWSAGLIAGWAFKTDRSTANLGADPYGLGLGLRGGYEWDFKLYTGVFFMYYLGSSETGSTALVNVPSQRHSSSYMHFGVEPGYDWWLGPVILRPSLQIGVAMAFTDNSPAGGTTSVTRLMFGPGFTLIDPIGSFFIAGDARANLVPSNNGVSSILLAVHFGLRF